jgi:hypothetical protein
VVSNPVKIFTEFFNAHPSPLSDGDCKITTTDMNEPIVPAAAQTSPDSLQPRSSWKRKLLITACVLFGIFGLTAASAAWWYHHNLHASPFKPVALTAGEQQSLDAKMAILGGKVQELEPPAPSDPAKTIVLNEREINAWLQQQGLGETVKFSIRNGGIAATILAPVEEEVPVLGGHTVRFQVAFNTKLDENRRFALSLADVNVGGISLPNAWLGGVKGLNLLAENEPGMEPSPFLKGFAAGIKDFQVRNGELRMVLND